MSRVYDSWEKLVGSVLLREELRRLAHCESLDSSITADFSSRFSFDSSIEDAHGASSRRSKFSYRDVRPVEFKEIVKATKNFQPDMFLGQGIFCQVFKGWIDEDTLTASNPGSGMAVVVKKWNPVGLERHQDWVKDIDHFSKLRHPNLVELVGYCSEEDNLILVYEFMPNGSLNNHLSRRGHQSFPWAARIKVAIDAARGLAFLHNTEIPTIHRDFKAANILIDGEYNAKLSNYCYGTDDHTGDTTHISTDQVVIAYGYNAPEYAGTGHITTKFNVYSFGVVLLELLTGRQVLDTMQQFIKEEEGQTLVDWAKRYFCDKRKLLQIMDTRLKGQYSHNVAYKVAKIALQCLSSDPKLRPTMSEVVAVLEQL